MLYPVPGGALYPAPVDFIFIPRGCDVLCLRGVVLCHRGEHCILCPGILVPCPQGNAIPFHQGVLYPYVKNVLHPLPRGFLSGCPRDNVIPYPEGGI